MKLFKKLLACLLIMLSVGSIYSEHITFGDYTTPGFFDGDLVIIGGKLDVNQSITVNGDLKIISGDVVVENTNPSDKGTDIYVVGDLIVTNTETSGAQKASIKVPTGKLLVKGEIYAKSLHHEAWIDAKYGIEAAKITTTSKLDSGIKSANGYIDVAGDVIAWSDGPAPVETGGHIRAFSISTNSGHPIGAYIKAGTSIYTDGKIFTNGRMGPGYVEAAVSDVGLIKSDCIYTRAKLDAHVKVGPSGGLLDVNGDINTRSAEGDGHVLVEDGNILVGGVFTEAENKAEVEASGYINVDGDIVTKSKGPGQNAFVEAGTTIRSSSISTKADGYAYVRAGTGIQVFGGIVTDGGYGAYVETIDGKLTADSIYTRAVEESAHIIAQNDELKVTGDIKTFSSLSTAYVNADQLVQAENIFTNGSTSAEILIESGPLRVDDIVDLRSSTDSARIWTASGVSARTILTNGQTVAYVNADDGDIIVEEDILTKSVTDDAYVHALSGDVKAKRIKTYCPATKDRSVKSQAGSGLFELFFDEAGVDFSIKDSEFYLDSDKDWNCMLTLVGSCTVDGRGHTVNFGTLGGMIIDANSNLTLKNIRLKDLGGVAIKGTNGTSELWLDDVVWTQTADYEFSNGSIKVIGDVLVNGHGKKFEYKSPSVSTIYGKSTLEFGPGVIFKYNTNDPNRLAMMNASSRLNFDDAILWAEQNIILKKGTLVIDNKVTFNPVTGVVIKYGDLNPANNLRFEHHVDSMIMREGDGTIDNDNA